MKKFQFIVHQDVIDKGVVIRGVRIHGIDNHHYPSNLEDYIRIHIQRFLDHETQESVKNNDIIQGFYDLHKEVNVPKRKNIPASENLLKILLKKKEMTRINPVVDIYNIISMESKLALGAHDIACVGGNISLRLTDGSENFIPLGQEEPKEVKEGIYSYIDDDNDIICYLEVRQVDKTKVTKESQDIFFIVQGNQNTSQHEVDQVAEELVTVMTYYLGGEGYLL